MEEIKIGRTTEMLLCLDREERMAFILGEICEVSGPEAILILYLWVGKPGLPVLLRCGSVN